MFHLGTTITLCNFFAIVAFTILFLSYIYGIFIIYLLRLQFTMVSYCKNAILAITEQKYF